MTTVGDVFRFYSLEPGPITFRVSDSGAGGAGTICGCGAFVQVVKRKGQPWMGVLENGRLCCHREAARLSDTMNRSETLTRWATMSKDPVSDAKLEEMIGRLRGLTGPQAVETLAALEELQAVRTTGRMPAIPTSVDERLADRDRTIFALTKDKEELERKKVALSQAIVLLEERVTVAESGAKQAREAQRNVDAAVDLICTVCQRQHTGKISDINAFCCRSPRPGDTWLGLCRGVLRRVNVLDPPVRPSEMPGVTGLPWQKDVDPRSPGVKVPSRWFQFTFTQGMFAVDLDRVRSITSSPTHNTLALLIEDSGEVVIDCGTIEQVKASFDALVNALRAWEDRSQFVQPIFPGIW